MPKPVICIGIPAFDGLESRVAEDYMRWMFHLGRRCQDYDFQLAIKGKSEQFRARNAIVKAALQYGADYILMIDDDHVICLDEGPQQSEQYSFPVRLVEHMQANEKIGVLGVLFWQRGGDFFPSIMQETASGGPPHFMHHSEVSGGLQKVDIVSGGCMMIRAGIFDRIEAPWFAPEHEYGTDIQLCKQARAAGYEVWSDTGIEIGHILRDKVVISSKTISGRWKESAPSRGVEALPKHLALYNQDVQVYTRLSEEQLTELAMKYEEQMHATFARDNLEQYYRNTGVAQIARQWWFHQNDWMVQQMAQIHQGVAAMFPAGGYGLDFGCGSAPVGFGLVLDGHKIDFIDIPGAPAYEFTKWRATERGVDSRCGFELGGPYDFALFLDSIEHLENWEEVLADVVGRLKLKGALITNFFTNGDWHNLEHISMDHGAVKRFLVKHNVFPISSMVWVKEADA